MGNSTSIFNSLTLSAGTLRDAAEVAGVEIGSIANPYVLRDQADARYDEILGNEFNLLTDELGCKTSHLLKSGPDSYDWNFCDSSLEFAKANNQAFKYHALFWTTQAQDPAWADSMSPQELESFCYNHIDAVAAKYGSDLKYIDVINEYVDQSSLYHNIPDFACKMFTYARAKFPSAVLIYNDFWFDDEKSDRIYNFVEDLNRRDCGLDMVGIQGHYVWPLIGIPSFLTMIRSGIQKFASIGLDVNFSEVDIVCSLFCSQSNQDNGFVDLLNICLTEPACKAFQFWGFTDRFSFRGGGDVSILPWDADFDRKESVALMIQEMKPQQSLDPSFLFRLLLLCFNFGDASC